MYHYGWLVVEMRNTESNGFRQDDFSDVCGRCGRNCCKEARAPVNSERMRIIESYLSKVGITVEKPFERDGYLFPRETSDGCIFLDAKTKRCMIQSFKPEICAAYPVTFDINLNKGTIEWYLHTDEICLLSGVLYRDKDIFKKHLESAKREIKAFIRGLQKEELLTVLKIEVPETFKIGEDPLEFEVLEKQE